MGPIIGSIVPYAVGVAISPLPIVALILMLSTTRARDNGPAFALGWMGTAAAICAAVVLVSGVMDVGAGGAAGNAGSLVELALGAILVALAVKEWRGRPAEGQAPAMPKWLQTLDTLSPRESAATAALLVGVNPKNLLLVIGAGLAIGETEANIVASLLGVVIFVLVASLSILAPLAVYFLAGARADAVLSNWKQSLSENNAVIMAVLLTVFGAILIGRGLGTLL